MMDPFAFNTGYPPDTYLDDTSGSFASTDILATSGGKENFTSCDGASIDVLNGVNNLLRCAYRPFKRAAIILLPILCYLALADAGTHCKLGVILSYSTQILCDLPTAMHPELLSNICDWTRHVHTSESNMFATCEGQLRLFKDDQCDKESTSSAAQFMTEITPDTENLLASTFVSTYPEATIIPGLTSPTSGLADPPFYAYLIHQYSGYLVHMPQIFRPSSILDGSVVQGECWHVSDGGHVGILLSQSLRISHISLNYPSLHLLSITAASRVPKRVSVWGMVANLADLEIANVTRVMSLQKPAAFATRNDDALYPASSHFLKLADFQYRSPSKYPRQYFPIDLDISFRILVVVFETNHGAEDTCIHSLGIHSL